MSPFAPDDLPAAVVDDPSHPPRTLAFIGFLGQSHTEGFVRLYLDEEMREWFDVAQSDVLHTEPEVGGPVPRTILWVDQRTTLQRRQAQPEDIHGEYLDGELAAVTVPQTATSLALDISVIRRTPMKHD